MRLAEKSAEKTFNPKARTSRQALGFSLIELLVVVAIILIIAAIAIPNLLNARMAANEAAAAETVRTITTASMAYSSTYQNGFPPALAALGGPAAGPATCDQAILMDPVITTAPNQKSGYAFDYTPVGAPVTAPPGCSAGGANGYLVTAIPVSHEVTGIRSFCSDEPGTIHVDTSGALPGSQAACEGLPILQ
jgi:prepilin-type N-terminal cleavage/methylation domain-containing protein